MKKLIAILLSILPFSTSAEIKWNIPVEEFGAFTNELMIRDLGVGDKAKIREYSTFCINSKGNLSVSSTTKVGSGDIAIRLVPGMKIELVVESTPEFLKGLIERGAYAECSWWTAHKGKYLVEISNINGYTDLKQLAKP